MKPKSPIETMFPNVYPRTPQKPPMTREQEVTVDHEIRILDLEKQVAELRAAPEEHLNPRTRKPRKGVDPNIYGSMLHD